MKEILVLYFTLCAAVWFKQRNAISVSYKCVPSVGNINKVSDILMSYVKGTTFRGGTRKSDVNVEVDLSLFMVQFFP